MYKIKRAIIMAAGLGSRMNPITQTTPKPLIEVNGVRMIDTVIDALHQNGITEIHIVVGHLKEKFEILKSKYQNVDLIENPYYLQYNNISSLYVARDFVSDAIILDGDQIIFNPSILSTEFERSGYNAIWTDEQTNEWLLNVEDGIIKSCSRTGGKGGWQLFSVSRWSAQDGQKLKNHLEEAFADENNRNLYWDDVALFLYPDEYKLGIKQMNKDDIAELDSIYELAEIDAKYKKFTEENKNEK